MAATAYSIDLRELDHELSRTKATVDAWAKQRGDAAAGRADAHAHAMHDQSVKLGGLKARQGELSVAAQGVKQRLEAEAQEAGALQGAAERAQAVQEGLELAVARMREVVRAKEAEAAAAEEAEQLSESIQNKRIAALRKGLDIYASRLGLHFKQVAEELHLVFTHVDARRPDRQFCVAVHVQGDKKTYTVTACEPPVAAMPGLLAQLNASNDFSEFAAGVRSAFQQACQL